MNAYFGYWITSIGNIDQQSSRNFEYLVKLQSGLDFYQITVNVIWLWLYNELQAVLTIKKVWLGPPRLWTRCVFSITSFLEMHWNLCQMRIGESSSRTKIWAKIFFCLNGRLKIKTVMNNLKLFTLSFFIIMWNLFCNRHFIVTWILKT